MFGSGNRVIAEQILSNAKCMSPESMFSCDHVVHFEFTVTKHHDSMECLEKEQFLRHCTRNAQNRETRWVLRSFDFQRRISTAQLCSVAPSESDYKPIYGANLLACRASVRSAPLHVFQSLSSRLGLLLRALTPCGGAAQAGARREPTRRLRAPP